MNVTVVIATLNRKDKLARTLNALRSQTYPYDRFEVIVVDNGSQDGTVAFVENLGREWPNLTCAAQPKRGPAAARNSGTGRARGEVIAFTDDDCVPPKDWLERLVDGYKRHPEVVGVGGFLEAEADVLASNVFAQYERYVAREVYKVGDQETVGGFDCPAGGTNNMSYLRRVVEEVGGFDETFPGAAGEDADLKKRICDRGYELAFMPVGITHLQTYNLAGFMRQARSRGFGAAHFHRKHGPSVRLGGIVLHLGVLLGEFFANMATSRRKDFAVLKLVEGICSACGQFRYVRRTKRG